MGQATATQTMMVEVDGRTEALEAKLAVLEQKLQSFQSKSEGAGGAAESAAEGLGERYAGASRHIAAATEEMSRMGEVGGRGLRELLAQGGEMAGMFGPEGAIIGAIAVTTMAISELFKKSEDQMDETARHYAETVGQMVKSKDLMGLSSLQQDLYSGEGAFATRAKDESPVDFRARQIGIAGAKAKIAALEAEVSKLRGDAAAAAPTVYTPEGSAAYEKATQALPRARAEIDEWTKALNGLEAKYGEVLPAIGVITGKVAEESKAQLARWQEEAAPGYAAMVESAKKSLESLRNASNESIAGGTKSAVDNAIGSLAQYQAQVRQAVAAIDATIKNPDALKRPNDATTAALSQTRSDILAAGDAEVQRRLKAIDQLASKEADSLRANIEGALGGLTGSMAQLGLKMIEEQSAEIRKQITEAKGLSDAEKDRLRNLQGISDQLRIQKNTAQDAVRDVERTIQAADLAGPVNSSFTALNAKAIELQQVLSKMVADGGEMAKQGDGYKQVVDALLKLDKERAALLAKMFGISKDDADNGRRRLKDLGDQARAIQQSVDGAVQLAQAFGWVDQKMAAVLRSLGQAAANIPVLVEQLSQLDKFDAKGNPIGTIGGVIGAALPIVGAVAGIVGSLIGHKDTSAADAEHARVIQQNTQALADLTKNIGVLGANAGNPQNFSKAYDLVSAALAAHSGLPSSATAQFAFGIGDADAVQAAAKALGITLDGTIGSYRELMAALAAGIPLLGKFGSDFASVMNEIDAQSKIFGDNGPLGNLATIMEKIAPMSDGIASIFKDIDTSKALTPEELDLVRKRVQDLFKAMTGEGLTTEQLGQLTGDDFLKLLEQIINDLNALTPAAQSAADKLNAANNSTNNNLAIYDVKDPTEIFKQKTAGYAGAIGGSLGDLLKTFTGTSPEDIAKYNQQLQEFFEKLKSSPESLDLAGLSIDDLIKVLLDLHGAADSVAAGIETAIQKMTEARSKLDTDFQVFGVTDPNVTAQSVIGFYRGASADIAHALDGIDTSTTAGLAAADKALQDLYSQNRDNADLTKEILDLLQHIRAVGGGPGGAATNGGGAPTLYTGNTEFAAGKQIQQISQSQASTIVDTLTMILATVREFEFGLFQRFDQFLADTLRLSAPLVPAGLLGVAGSGQTIVINVVNEYYGPIGALDQSSASLLATQQAEELNRTLGRRYVSSNRFAGNTMQS